MHKIAIDETATEKPRYPASTMESDAVPLPDPARQRDRFAPVYHVLEEAIAAHAFPGCAFGVIADGQVVLQDALGQFTYESDSPRVTPATVYDVASLTKVVATTAMAMLLHQRGQLDVDTPVGDLLPEFVAHRAMEDPARRVRLRHLLAHNSGLPGYVEFFRMAETPDALLHACLSLALEAEPGARPKYSDPGFILLGKVLEVIANEDLASWAHRNLYAPLTMTATGFCPPAPATPAIPPTEEDTGLRLRRIQGEVQDENAWVLHGTAGHAGLFSNVPDLLRFAGAVLRAETKRNISASITADEPDLFHAATLEFFAHRQDTESSSRALGWDTPSPPSSAGQYFSPHSIGHLGYSGCSLWIDLDAAIAAVLLTNRTWPRRESQLIRQVRPAFHNALRQSIQRLPF